MPPAKRAPVHRGQASSRTAASVADSKRRNLYLAKKLDGRLIMGVDPGMTTGVVLTSTAAILREQCNLSVEEMYEFLDNKLAARVQLVIMEEFITGNRAAKLMGSRNEASTIIGVVQMWAHIHKIPIVMQMPAIKGIAEKLSGKVPKGAHANNHWLDAFNHVFYFLYDVGLIAREGGKIHATKAAETIRDNESNRQSAQ